LSRLRCGEDWSSATLPQGIVGWLARADAGSSGRWAPNRADAANRETHDATSFHKAGIMLRRLVTRKRFKALRRVTQRAQRIGRSPAHSPASSGAPPRNGKSLVTVLRALLDTRGARTNGGYGPGDDSKRA